MFLYFESRVVRTPIYKLEFKWVFKIMKYVFLSLMMLPSVIRLELNMQRSRIIKRILNKQMVKQASNDNTSDLYDFVLNYLATNMVDLSFATIIATSIAQIVLLLVEIKDSVRISRAGARLKTCLLLAALNLTLSIVNLLGMSPQSISKLKPAIQNFIEEDYKYDSFDAFKQDFIDHKFDLLDLPSIYGDIKRTNRNAAFPPPPLGFCFPDGYGDINWPASTRNISRQIQNWKLNTQQPFDLILKFYPDLTAYNQSLLVTFLERQPKPYDPSANIIQDEEDMDVCVHPDSVTIPEPFDTESMRGYYQKFYLPRDLPDLDEHLIKFKEHLLKWNVDYKPPSDISKLHPKFRDPITVESLLEPVMERQSGVTGLDAIAKWFLTILASIFGSSMLHSVGINVDVNKLVNNYIGITKAKGIAQDELINVCESMGMETARSRFIKKCNDCVTDLNKFLSTSATEYANDSFMLEKFKLTTETAENILAEARTMEFTNLANVLKGVYSAANKYRIDLVKTTLVSKRKFEPIVYCFQGPLGVGKTQLMMALAKHLGEKLFPDIPEERRIIQITTENKYWPQLSGQPIAVFDESASTAKLSDCLLWHGMRALASPASFNCEAADIEHKSQPCPFRIILTTTNNTLQRLSRLITETYGEPAVCPTISRMKFIRCTRNEKKYGKIDINNRDSNAFDTTGNFGHIHMRRLLFKDESGKEIVEETSSYNFDSLCHQAIEWYKQRESAFLNSNRNVERQAGTAVRHVNVCFYGPPDGGKSTAIRKVVADLTNATQMSYEYFDQDSDEAPRSEAQISIFDDYLPVPPDFTVEKKFMNTWNNTLPHSGINIIATNKIPWSIPFGIKFEPVIGCNLLLPTFQWKRYLPVQEPGIIRRMGWDGDFLFQNQFIGNINLFVKNSSLYLYQKKLMLHNAIAGYAFIILGLIFSYIIHWSLVIIGLIACMFCHSPHTYEAVSTSNIAPLIYKAHAANVSGNREITVSFGSVIQPSDPDVHLISSSIESLKFPKDLMSLQTYAFHNRDNFLNANLEWKMLVNPNLVQKILPAMDKFIIRASYSTATDIENLICLYVRLMKGIGFDKPVIFVEIGNMGRFLYQDGMLTRDSISLNGNTVYSFDVDSFTVINANAEIFKRFTYNSFFNAKFNAQPLVDITETPFSDARILNSVLNDNSLMRQPLLLEALKKWRMRVFKDQTITEASILAEKFKNFLFTPVGKVLVVIFGLCGVLFMGKKLMDLITPKSRIKNCYELLKREHKVLTEEQFKQAILDVGLCYKCQEGDFEECAEMCEIAKREQCKGCKRRGYSSCWYCEYSCIFQLYQVLYPEEMIRPEYLRELVEHSKDIGKLSQRKLRNRRGPGSKKPRKLGTDIEDRQWIDDSSGDEFQRKRPPGSKKPRRVQTDEEITRRQVHDLGKESVERLPDMNDFHSMESVYAREHQATFSNLCMIFRLPTSYSKGAEELECTKDFVSQFVSVYGLIVKDDKFLTVQHVFRDKNYEVYVCEDDLVAKDGTVYKLRKLKVHETWKSRDLVLASAKFNRQYKDITNLFISKKSDENFEKYHESIFCRYGPNKIKEFSMGRCAFALEPERINFSPDPEVMDHFIETVYNYSSHMRSTYGDCGLPHHLVTAGSPNKGKIIGLHFAGSAPNAKDVSTMANFIFKEELLDAIYRNTPKSSSWFQDMISFKSDTGSTQITNACPGCKEQKEPGTMTITQATKAQCRDHFIVWDAQHEAPLICMIDHVTYYMKDKANFVGSIEMNYGNLVPHSEEHPHTHFMHNFWKDDQNYNSILKPVPKLTSIKFQGQDVMYCCAKVKHIENLRGFLRKHRAISQAKVHISVGVNPRNKELEVYIAIVVYEMKNTTFERNMKNTALTLGETVVYVPSEIVDIVTNPIKNKSSGKRWDIPFPEDSKRVSVFGSFSCNQSHIPKNIYCRIPFSQKFKTPVAKLPFNTNTAMAPPDQLAKLVCNNDGELDPRVTQSVQWAYNEKEIERSLVKHLVRELSAGWEPLYGNLKELDDFSVLHGVKENNGLQRLQLDKSIGWTLSSAFCVTRKSDVLSISEDGVMSWKDNECAKFAKLWYEEGCKMIRRGERPFTCYLELIKMEKLKPNKNFIGRIFCAEDLLGVLWSRKFLGSLVVKSTLEDRCVGVGTNAWKDFDEIYRELRRKGHYFTGDYSRWDKTIPFSLFQVVADTLCNINPERKIGLRTAISLFATSIHVSGKTMFTTNGGMPSGTAVTANFNSLLNEAAMFFAYCRLTQDMYGYLPSYQTFNSNIFRKYYGDDVIIGVSDEVKYFTQQNVSRIMDEIGLVLSAADKEGKLVDFEPIEKVSWISRYFRQLDFYPTVVGALKKESICSWLHWTTILTPEQIGSQFTSALYEASLWETDFFEMIRNDIMNCIKEDPRIREFVILQAKWMYQQDIFEENGCAALFRQVSFPDSEGQILYNNNVEVVCTHRFDYKQYIKFLAFKRKQLKEKEKMVEQVRNRFLLTNQNLTDSMLTNLPPTLNYRMKLNEAYQQGLIMKPEYEYFQGGDLIWHCNVASRLTKWCSSIEIGAGQGISKATAGEAAAEILWNVLFPKENVAHQARNNLLRRFLEMANPTAAVVAASQLPGANALEDITHKIPDPIFYLYYITLLVFSCSIFYLVYSLFNNVGNKKIRFKTRSKRTYERHSGIEMSHPGVPGTIPSGQDMFATAGSSIMTNTNIGMGHLELNTISRALDNPAGAAAPFDFLTYLYSIYQIHKTGTISTQQQRGGEVFRVSLDPQTWPTQMKRYVDLHQSIIPALDVSIVINGAAGALGTMKLGWVPDASKTAYTLEEIQMISSTDLTFNTTTSFSTQITDIRRTGLYRKINGDTEPYPGIVALISMPPDNVQRTGTVSFGFEVYVKLSQACCLMDPNLVVPTPDPDSNKLSNQLYLEDYTTFKEIDLVVGGGATVDDIEKTTFNSGVDYTAARFCGYLTATGWYVDIDTDKDKIITDYEKSNVLEVSTYKYQMEGTSDDRTFTNRVIPANNKYLFSTEPTEIVVYTLFGYGTLPRLPCVVTSLKDLGGTLCSINPIPMKLYGTEISQVVTYKDGGIFLVPTGEVSISNGYTFLTTSLKKDDIRVPLFWQSYAFENGYQNDTGDYDFLHDYVTGVPKLIPGPKAIDDTTPGRGWVMYINNLPVCLPDRANPEVKDRHFTIEDVMRTEKVYFYTLKKFEKYVMLYQESLDQSAVNRYAYPESLPSSAQTADGTEVGLLNVWNNANTMMKWFQDLLETSSTLSLQLPKEYVFTPVGTQVLSSTTALPTGLCECFFAQPGFSANDDLTPVQPANAVNLTTLARAIKRVGGNSCSFTFSINGVPEANIFFSDGVFIVKPVASFRTHRGIKTEQATLTNFQPVSAPIQLVSTPSTSIGWTDLVAGSALEEWRKYRSTRRMVRQSAFGNFGAGALYGAGYGLLGYMSSQNWEERAKLQNELNIRYMEQEYNQRMRLQRQKQQYGMGLKGVQNGGALGNLNDHFDAGGTLAPSVSRPGLGYNTTNNVMDVSKPNNIGGIDAKPGPSGLSRSSMGTIPEETGTKPSFQKPPNILKKGNLESSKPLTNTSKGKYNDDFRKDLEASSVNVEPKVTIENPEPEEMASEATPLLPSKDNDIMNSTGSLTKYLDNRTDSEEHLETMRNLRATTSPDVPHTTNARRPPPTLIASDSRPYRRSVVRNTTNWTMPMVPRVNSRSFTPSAKPSAIKPAGYRTSIPAGGISSTESEA